MPQLRDSGTRSLHATEPVPSAEMDGFCRIFGVETEYGVAVTGAERPVDAGQVAMTMFQPIVSRSRSTNTYLANGSRLYLDQRLAKRDPRTSAPDLASEMMRNCPEGRRSARPREALAKPPPPPICRRRTRDAQPGAEGPAQAT